MNNQLKSVFVSVIGGRPNVIKVEPIHRHLTKIGVKHIIIDLGVYRKPYGQELFNDLELPFPRLIEFDEKRIDYLSNIKKITSELTKVFKEIEPVYILVYGDINPGVAVALLSSQLGIPTLHVEAGLRNFNLSDTEEINRLIIDHFATKLLAPSNSAKHNLIKEGFSEEKIYVVGNTIINALKRHLPKAKKTKLYKLGLQRKPYGLVTIHREENLSSRKNLLEIINALLILKDKISIIFIQYASTRKALIEFGLDSILKDRENLFLIQTLSYHEYLGILNESAFVITDSSGLQDETTFLGIPCITLRENTHRVDTITIGTNKIVLPVMEEILETVIKIIESKDNFKKDFVYPKEWDLDTGYEISKVLLEENYQ